MKRFFNFLILFSWAISSYGQIENREYIEPQDFYIEDNEIFMKFEDEWLPVQRILVSNNSLNSEKASKFSIVFNTWECPECHWQNNKQQPTCQNCGYYNEDLDR